MNSAHTPHTKGRKGGLQWSKTLNCSGTSSNGKLYEVSHDNHNHIWQTPEKDITRVHLYLPDQRRHSVLKIQLFLTHASGTKKSSMEAAWPTPAHILVAKLSLSP